MSGLPIYAVFPKQVPIHDLAWSRENSRTTANNEPIIIASAPAANAFAKSPEYFARYRAIIKNKIDSSILIKAEGGTKKGAEKKGMQICMDQSIQSSFKEACYVHYSGLKPEY